MRAGRSSPRQELRDLWLGGRGLLLLFALQPAAERDHLPWRDQRGAQLPRAARDGQPHPAGRGRRRRLLALLAAADAISGERERGTLESLLLTPVVAAGLVAGKLLAALSLWLARAGRRPFRTSGSSGATSARSATRSAPASLVGTLRRDRADGLRDHRQLARRLQPPQPLGQPVRPAGAVRADPAAGRRQAGVGGRAAAAREPDDRRRALHRQRRHQPVRLDAGAALAGRRRSSRAVGLTVVAVVVVPRFMRCAGERAG